MSEWVGGFTSRLSSSITKRVRCVCVFRCRVTDGDGLGGHYTVDHSAAGPPVLCVGGKRKEGREGGMRGGEGRNGAMKGMMGDRGNDDRRGRREEGMRKNKRGVMRKWKER